MRRFWLAARNLDLLRHKCDSVVMEDVSSQLVVRVAVIGLPNCGKSTLVNRLMGQKVILHAQYTSLPLKWGFKLI